MKTIAVLVVSAGLLLGWGCAWAQARAARQEAPAERRLAYIDALKVPAEARAGKPIVIRVEGSLPDPSWELAEIAQGREAGQRISLKPWMTKKTDDPVIQVIVPFEREVKLAGLPAGRWELALHGFGDALATAALTVRP